MADEERSAVGSVDDGCFEGSFPIDRRDLMRVTGVSVFGTASLAGSGVAAGSTDGGVVFAEDFESYTPGDVPDSFVLAGSTDQAVVDADPPAGTQAYRMRGSHGGCWRAIMRRELFDGESQPKAMQISGQFRLADGAVGCHDDRSGAIRWRTIDSSSWSEGSGASLLQFRPDGTVTSAGETVGAYDRREWTSFEVVYERDPDTGTVTHTCTVGDGARETVTRDVRENEADLTALALRSDDFTVFWNDLRVEAADATATGTVTGTVTDERTGDPIADAEIGFVDTETDERLRVAMTDETGSYQAELPAEATYEAVLDTEGYEARSASVSVASGQTETVDFALSQQYAEFDAQAATKLNVAAELDGNTVSFDETPAVETILEEFRADLEAGVYPDQRLPVEAVERHVFAEQTANRLIEKTGPTDTPGGEQIAVTTTSFVTRLGVSLVMLQLSISDLLDDTDYGDLLPESGRLIEDIDTAIGELVSAAFSTVRQSEAIAAITETARNAYNELLAGTFATADEFTAFMGDSIAETATNLTIQPAIESGTGYDPFSDTVGFNVIDRFANIEQSLAYARSELNSETVRTNGLAGDREGAIEATNQAQQAIGEIASTVDTFLTELSDRVNFIGILSNVYELVTSGENDAPIWQIVGFVATAAVAAGKAVAVVNAIGTMVGQVSIRVLLTINAVGILGIQRGKPLDLDAVTDIVPRPDEVLSNLDLVDDRWGDVA